MRITLTSFHVFDAMCSDDITTFHCPIKYVTYFMSYRVIEALEEMSLCTGWISVHISESVHMAESSSLFLEKIS